jgi:hypothetical protein
MKSIPKIKIHMYLPESKGLPVDKLYDLFRKRALRKSNDAYVHGSREPVQMILNVNDDMYDAQTSVIVIHKSFKPITNPDNEEIGFNLTVYSALDQKKRLLTVFKIGKAFTEFFEDIDKAMKARDEKSENK